MDDGLEPAALQPVHQFRRRHDIGELALGEIAPFAVMAEQVAHRHVARPASFNAATTFDPIKPAPPVTSNMPSPALIVRRQLCPTPARQATRAILDESADRSTGFTCRCGAVTDGTAIG